MSSEFLQVLPRLASAGIRGSLPHGRVLVPRVRHHSFDNPISCRKLSRWMVSHATHFPRHKRRSISTISFPKLHRLVGGLHDSELTNADLLRLLVEAQFLSISPTTLASCPVPG